MDTGVIIARAGGSMESDSSGSMVQGKDQSMSEAQVKAVLNDMQLQNPVIIICGDKNVGSPVKMPHKYCVLGWYKPTMVWTEKTAGRAKKDYVTVKYRFERLGLDSDKAAWYEPRDRRDLPSSEHVGAMEKHTCLDCNQESARIYLEGWFCLNSECASFWKLSDESAPTGPMNYDPAFLLHRTNWETEIEPYDVRIPPPDLGKTIGSHLSYINTRGIVCPKCGRCNPRYHFRGWVCDNVNSKCDWKLDAVQQPVTQTALHQPWDTFGNGPSLARNKHEPCVSVKVTSAFGYKVYTYRVDGINGKLVHAVSNKRINGEPDGPDEMFEELQVKDMGLERRRFKVERGSGSKAKAAKTASDVLTTPTKSPSMQNDQLPTPSSELQVLIPPSIGQDAGPKSVDAVAQLQSRRMEDDAGSAFQAAVLSTDVEIDAEAQPNGATDTAHSLAACVSDEESGAWASQPIRNALGAEMTAEAGAQAAESIKSSTAQTSIPREVEMVSTRSQATAGADVISADSEDQTTSAAAASPVSEHGDVAHRTAENCAEAELSADKADKVLNSPTIGAPILERADPNPQLTTKVAADMGMIAPTDEPVEPVDPSKAGTQPDEGGVETGDFMTAFSVNYGMPYKFVAGGASRSFEDAPRAARACRSRLQWAAKNLMKDPEGNTDFNEELIFAYLEGQKIEYHDDGEEGLGPCITTLSLGGSAKMSLRMKAKYHFGCSKTGVFNQEKPIPGSVKYDQRLKAWEELQTVSDRSEYQRRLKALPKGLGIYADRNKKAGDLVNITLNHGDIVVMDGYDIQKYLEHKVAPEGFLRFALTCRTVLPNHLKPGELPPYEVREDDFGYDGSNVL
ncbi:hypothetical protein EJ03DRAFT_332041 [Teratosphaeria nubilosa]|uniref:YDG domain-containing protein n=1 Tax=Teratosphaeria nubilosa TaxID=161662 RepID=A0A6G1KUG5_9PEZI|nr:hypothetical protein EJ03DRAFT_332041 [Teratosphaeria nubilosa]